MSVGAIVNARLQVLRSLPIDPAVVDEWNQPAYASDAVVATVDGVLQPLTNREVVTLSDAGAQIGDLRLFTDAAYVHGDGSAGPLDVGAADRIRDVTVTSPQPVYEIRSRIEHRVGFIDMIELLLRRVIE